MSEPSYFIQKSTILAPNGEDEDTNLLLNAAYSSFYRQDHEESNHLLSSSSCFENYSSNLQNSIPVATHLNNLQKTPKTVSFVHHINKLRSSTPKASSLLSPFASDVTEIKFKLKDTNCKNQNTTVSNCEKLILDISNDTLDFQSTTNFSQFKRSSYVDYLNNSLNCSKFKCHNTQNETSISSYLSAKELKTPATNAKLPILTNKTINESLINSVNEYRVTENELEILNKPDSCKHEEIFSILNGPECKCNEELNKTCNSNSLFASFKSHDSDLISFQDDLEWKSNNSYIDKIHLKDSSSKLNGKSLSSDYEPFGSVEQFQSRDISIVNDLYDETVNDMMNDILNHLFPKMPNTYVPHHYTEEKNDFPINDGSDVHKEAFCILNNAENTVEVSEITSIKSKIQNSKEFITDKMKINEATIRCESNTDNANSKNDFNFFNLLNNNKENISEFPKTLNFRGRNSKAIKIQEITANSRLAGFPGKICKDLTNLLNGTFPTKLQICSDFTKSKADSTESLFVNSKPEPIVHKEYWKHTDNEKYSSHMTGLPIRDWRPFKMELLKYDSKMSVNNNFKALVEKFIENIMLFNIPICKTQEIMLNFEVYDKSRLLCNQNSNSLIRTGFLNPVTISLQNLIVDKSNELNSHYSIHPYGKGATSKLKPQDAASKNPCICLQSNLSLSIADAQNSAFERNEISLKIFDSISNSKLHNVRQMSNESKICEYLENDKDNRKHNGLDNKEVLKSKVFQNISNAATLAPINNEALNSQSKRFEVSRFPEDISKTYNLFPSRVSINTSIKSSSKSRTDSSETVETDISITSNSDSEDSMEISEEVPKHGNKRLPLQELFDIDKMIAKAVIQTFTDLGSSRGLKQSQILKYINQHKMIKRHSKVNRDIQNFLKVSNEVGIMSRKGLRYFLSEGSNSFSKKKKEIKNKCKTVKTGMELKVKTPALTRVKARRTTLEVITPEKIKTRNVSKMKTLKTPAPSTGAKAKRSTIASETCKKIKTRRAAHKEKIPALTRIKTKKDASEMITPQKMKTRKAAFKIKTPASARIKQFKKGITTSLPSSSNSKYLLLSNEAKSYICHKTKIELRSPTIYKNLRSRVILMKKDA
ncbi:hypothetical protein HNY73_016356 [Argiope bruennichi]|uniref:Uncharacterized protein n=1 Tax=Argiope bruennichi TaxID=94029 RepID=A0A8T0EIK5_ARGBR|nr:hypothetical protein HNY73_016356 [Argiope bruennichi]